MAEAEKNDKTVTVTVNNKPVVLKSTEVTGAVIKQAAKDQGVDIQLDFQLWEEAHGDKPMRSIGDTQEIKVNKNSVFTCNTGDHDS